MVQNCVVSGCKSEAYQGCSKSFYRFPNDEETIRKCIQALNINKIAMNSVVWSLHFKNDDYLKVMDSSKKHVTGAQVTALMHFMQEHSDIAKGFINSGLDKEDLEAKWQDLTTTLNSMGGPVKSVEKWKKTWQYLKSNTKKRAFKQQQQPCDTNVGLGMSSDGSGEPGQYINNDEVPAKKRYVSFDEEIVKIERDKLELEREYKIQKIEVLSRIAAALEELASK